MRTQQLSCYVYDRTNEEYKRKVIEKALSDLGLENRLLTNADMVSEFCVIEEYLKRGLK